MKRNLIFTLVLTISISLSVMFFPCQSEARGIELVSTGSTGQADFNSRYNSISSDGRYVAFASEATNLTAIPVDDPINHNDYNVYIKDTQTGDIWMASKNDAGTAGGNNDSRDPSISDDGLYVVFESRATNLVAGDNNGEYDVFIYDRLADTLVRISMDTALGESDGDSYDPVITPDGRYVAFESDATDLVTGDGNAVKDAFVYDSLGAGNGITLVSSNISGDEGNAISCDPDISDDGLFVAFASQATDLGPVTTALRYNVFLKDLTTGAVTLLSQNSSNAEGDADSEYPSISADGSIVAFESAATNLDTADTNTFTDVYIWDTGVVELLSKDSAGDCGNGESIDASISADGSCVGFESEATDLVSNDTNGFWDVFIKNISTGAVERLSISISGPEDDDSYNASLSSDGSYVAFDSDVELIAEDINTTRDVFVSSPSSAPPADDDDSGSGGCFINACSIFK